MKGAISAHSGSVRSLAYLSPTRACWRRVSSVQAIVISVQLCNRTEAQPAELTQLVSNQALRYLLSVCSEFGVRALPPFVHRTVKVRSPPFVLVLPRVQTVFAQRTAALPRIAAFEAFTQMTRSHLRQTATFCRVRGLLERHLTIIIAMFYVNTTSTTQRLFAYISKRLNAPNVGGSR